MTPPPLKPGQKLDPDSEYAKWWPGQPALFKFTDRVTLAIPPQFQEFWIQRDRVIRMPAPLEKVPQRDGQLRFFMFMPDFSGFTPDNYLRDFDDDRVEIYVSAPTYPNEGEPGAPGYHTPNMMQRLITYQGLNPDRHEVIHGLRCYETKPHKDFKPCWGQRRTNPDEWLILDVLKAPSSVPNPLIQTQYYSSQFGGFEVLWRTHQRNWPRWKEIDQQIWKYLEAWNVAPQPGAADLNTAP